MCVCVCVCVCGCVCVSECVCSVCVRVCDITRPSVARMHMQGPECVHPNTFQQSTDDAFLIFSHRLKDKSMRTLELVSGEITTRWLHLVFIVRGFAEGEGFTIYHDGVEVGRALNFENATNGWTGYPIMVFGEWQDNGVEISIDELLIWHKELSARDVEVLYKSY